MRCVQWKEKLHKEGNRARERKEGQKLGRHGLGEILKVKYRR